MSKKPTESNDLTLFASGRGLAKAFKAEAVPSTIDRWQPTRAGVVNSWAWIDEQFLFNGGWLALVGKNGSGKSITGAQFFPTMIDGNTSPSALSLSSRNSGSLAERHHNRTPHLPKTGVWWLEFGRSSKSGDQDDWYTVGLWLRWKGEKAGSPVQAWFITPGRVGTDLRLYEDGVPVEIETLAEQLASVGGRLFTDDGQLHKTAARQIVVEERAGFQTAVQSTLYTGAGSEQMAALTNVLRAVRSVRVNDRMTADEMRAILTSALPVLSSEYLQTLARDLTHSDDLRNKVNTAQQEHEHLGALERGYRTYAAAVGAATGHALLIDQEAHKAAVESGKALHKRVAALGEEIDTAASLRDEADHQAETLNLSISTLRSRAAGHPGAHIPQLQEKVGILKRALDHARQQLNGRQEAVNSVVKAESEAMDYFEKETTHLRSLEATLSRGAEQVNVKALCEGIAAATVTLCADPDEVHSITEGSLEECSTPLISWTEQRTDTIAAIRSADIVVSERVAAEAKNEQRFVTAQTEVHQAAENVQHVEGSVVEAHAELLKELQRWQGRDGRCLSAVPDDLPGQLMENPGELRIWADKALADAVTEIDLAGAEARAEAAENRAVDLRSRCNETQQSANTARGDLQEILSRIAKIAQEVPAPPERFATWQQDAEALQTGNCESPVPQTENVIQVIDNRMDDAKGASQLLAAAAAAIEKAEEDAATSTTRSEALSAAVDVEIAATSRRDAQATQWVNQYQTWSMNLKALDVSRLELPTLQVAVDGEIHSFAQIALEAGYTQVRELQPQLGDARLKVARLRDELVDIESAIAEAECGAETPYSPPWRRAREDDPGVGAPFWALVDFAPHLTNYQRSGIEGALLASGILDAWVDPQATHVMGDVVVNVDIPSEGPSLADVLVPQPTPSIDAAYINTLLRHIAFGASDNGEPHLADATLRNGVLVATSPADWSPRYIGTAAREAERQRLLADLEKRRTEVDIHMGQAQELLTELEDRITCVQTEAAQTPDSTCLLDAREAVRRATQAASEERDHFNAAQQCAAESRQTADHAISLATQTCSTLHMPPDKTIVDRTVSACAALLQQLPAAKISLNSLAACLESEKRACDAVALADSEAVKIKAEATAAEHQHRQAHHDHTDIPSADALTRSLVAFHQASTTHNQLVARAAELDDNLQQSRQSTAEAKKQRDLAAKTLDGRQLPFEGAELDDFEQAVAMLHKRTNAWHQAAVRLLGCRTNAYQARVAATNAHHALTLQTEEVKEAANHLELAQHQLAEERRTHESTYQEVLDELEAKNAEHKEAVDTAKKQDQVHREKSILKARVEEQHANAGEKIEQAARRRDESEADLRGLFEHALTKDVPGCEDLPNPNNLHDSLKAAAALTGKHPATTAQTSATAALKTLSTKLRDLQPTFSRMGKRVETTEIGTAGHHHIVVHDSNTAYADAGYPRSLRAAIKEIKQKLEKFTREYDEQLRTDIKGALFSQLRVQINNRIEQATQIVKGINVSLLGVRTGTENVGVRLHWDERKDDPTAQEGLHHIQSPNTDGNYDAMYEFFLRRLREEKATNEPAHERIRRVFDYRDWFTWTVEVTHNAFNDGTNEVFKKISNRNNPLDTLSTGEKRLASMLPLLAAVKSFYSTPGFEGPRLVFIDELDAALDPQNLRTLLTLLREWDLDVIATLPTMDKLLVPDVAFAIHHIKRRKNGTRFSIPYLWRGHGRPEAVRIAVPTPRQPHVPEENSTE